MCRPLKPGNVLKTDINVSERADANLVTKAPDRSCTITHFGFISCRADEGLQCCQGTLKLPNPFAWRPGEEEGKKRSEAVAGEVPTNPSSHLLHTVGHSAHRHGTPGHCSRGCRLSIFFHRAMVLRTSKWADHTNMARLPVKLTGVLVTLVWRWILCYMEITDAKKIYCSFRYHNIRRM